MRVEIAMSREPFAVSSTSLKISMLEHAAGSLADLNSRSRAIVKRPLAAPWR
jgi:hypothetical protein